jgi:hypothetical protein
MKIRQFLNSNDEFLSKQMKSLSFISEPNNYTYKQVEETSEKNYCQIKFEKPKFKLNISEKFEKIPLLPSDILKPPKTAPPRTTTSLHVKLARKRANNNASCGASTPGSSISSGSQLILKKNMYITTTNKQKDIKEWAFKKLKFEQDQKNLEEQEQKDTHQNLTKLKYGHQFWYDEVDELNQFNTGDDIDLTQLENEDEDAEFYRNHRSANLNKALNQKNFTSKLLDAKLIDLSKQRFKDSKNLSFQKKIFARHQLSKAKNLPGLK